VTSLHERQAKDANWFEHVYGNCIDGQGEAANERIAAVLDGRTGSGRLVAGGAQAPADASPAAGQTRDADHHEAA
jgi:hypothetical protein